MDLNVVGRVALVTGAAGGIGAAIAETLSREGAIVYDADIDERAVTERAKTLESLGYAAHPVVLDVSRAEEAERAIEEIVGREGKLEILVNCAGVLRMGPLQASRAEDWDALSSVNVGGIYACSKAAVRVMTQRSYGKILNLASISAFKGGGLVGNALYGTSKAAVVALTQGFAREYGPLGINVNAIAPGLTDTPMIASLDAATRERIVASIPLRRIATPSEIANLAAFLVSDLASYINGSTVVIDGGVLTL